MKEKLEKVLKDIIKKEYNIELANLKLENPPKKDLWDFAFWAFILAKNLKKNPNEIAQDLKELFEKSEFIEKIELAWPYLNIKVSKTIFSKKFFSYFDNFTKNKIFEKKDTKIVVDYIWANVWKPLHIGHMCTPNIWQAIINLYKKLGFEVISDSHIWDWGIIFGKLITAYKLWWEEKKLKENAVDYLLELYIKITSEAEKDSSIEEKTRFEFKELSLWNKDSIKLWENFTSYSIKAMNKELSRLNVKPDYNIWESFYEWIWLPKLENYPDLKKSMTDIVWELINKKIATINNDNSVWVEFDKNTKIPSCILRKRDLTHWYLASDLTAIKYRIDNFNPEKIIYFVDVRQSLHFRQAFEIAKKADWLENTKLIHCPNWFIKLKDWAMSTRKWKIIKLDLLLDEAEKRAKTIILSKWTLIKWENLDNLARIIWIWAIKYGYLKKSRETDIIFDWDEFMTFEGNSWPYIQYSYVRSKKILKKYSENYNLLDILNSKNGSFENDEELELLKKLMDYKDILEETAEKNMPHILCKYTYELTKTFSNFYNNIHILNEQDEEKKSIRIKLIYLFSKHLEELFQILAIELPEEM